MLWWEGGGSEDQDSGRGWRGEYSEPPAVILPPAVRIGALSADIRREKLIIFSPRALALGKKLRITNNLSHD